MKVATARLVVFAPMHREMETAGRRWHGSPVRGKRWIWGRVKVGSRARLELRMEDMVYCQAESVQPSVKETIYNI